MIMEYRLSRIFSYLRILRCLIPFVEDNIVRLIEQLIKALIKSFHNLNRRNFTRDEILIEFKKYIKLSPVGLFNSNKASQLF